jgi:hypothetical protein
VITRQLKQSPQMKKASRVQKFRAYYYVQSLTQQDMVRLIEQTNNYDLLFPLIREQLAARINNVVKQAHIKSLATSLVSAPRVEHLQTFHWFVRRTSQTLILGDVGCLFEIDSKFKSVGGTKDNIQRIYVPISSDCVVVATVTDELPGINPLQVNEASAKVSRDYFVAHERSPENVRLQGLLGLESDPLTKTELKQIVAEVIEESS